VLKQCLPQAGIEKQLQQLQGLSARKKYKQLIEAENSFELVQSMPPQELFLLIKELGVVDSADLIGLATPEQVTLCVDMDCWRGDELDRDLSMQWLYLLMIQDEEAFLRLIDGFDFELLVMMVKKQLTIISGLESLRDDEDLMATRKRFDQVYDCSYRNDDVAKIMSAFQDVLFRERQELFLQVMEAVRHEFDLALQECVFTDRMGRLEDLGFVDPFAARSLFSWIDPDTFDPDNFLKPDFVPSFSDGWSPSIAPPTFMLSLAQPHDLLGELLSSGLSHDLAYEFSFLLNRALSAEKVDYGEPQDIARVLQDVYYTLNIALGYLAGADLDRAEQLLRGVYLQALYQLGFSLTLQLRHRAQDIVAAPIGPYLDGPDIALIEALNQAKPQFFNGIVDATRADVRSFQTWAEVVKVRQELDCVERLSALFSDKGVFNLPEPEQLDLTGCIPALATEVTLSEFFLTALANRLLGRDFYPQPIAVAELLLLHEKVSLPAPEFKLLRQQTHDWVESQVPGSGTFANFCLDIWQQEFCSLAREDVTPEYVGGLIIRL
jgi:hypothetical protein